MPSQSHYTKVQQYLSYLLIFAILFLNSFQIPVIDKLSADSSANYQIVSLIVHEDIYSSIKSRVKRYAEDIQAKMNNTKAIIYTVPRDITPQKISALNEKLFYEGDLENPSRLVGTVLIGDIPLPVIHDSEKTFLSVYPYVDFNEKNFVFSPSKGFYESVNDRLSDPNPEIWHGVIAPNTGDLETDKIKLIEFFDKDHDYHTKAGVFEKNLLEPYVFYYDGKRDEQVVSYSLWKGYELFLQNVEDIAYFRYTKYLTKKIADAFYARTTKESNDALRNAGGTDPELLKYLNDNLGNSGPDVSKTPDVMTKKIIETMTKNFFQVFSEKYVGDILKYAYNTGRYGNPKNTRVDSVISIISKQDNMMKRLLKDTNTSFEGFTDDLLKKGLARNMAVPVKIEESKHHRFESGEGACDGYTTNNYPQFENSGVGVLENFYYGKIGSTLTKANQCSVMRGSKRTEDNRSLLVEATRAQIATQAAINADLTKLQNSPNAQTCLPSDDYQTMGFWGGYSLLNIDRSAIEKEGEIKLKQTDYRRATLPIYDVGGGLAMGYDSSTDTQKDKTDVAGNIIHGSTVNDCLQFNLLYTGPNLSPGQQACNNAFSNHQAPYAYMPYIGSRFEDIYKNTDKGTVYFTSASGYDYHNRYLYLDGANVGADKGYLKGDNGSCSKYIIHSKYYYKKILGMVEHKSPDNEEYGAQLKNMTTPSLPVDRDRYVDFISAKGNQKKFEYPNLFRIEIAESRDLNYDHAKKRLKEYLDSKSKDLNAIISSENPSSLGGLDAEIYNLLKVQNAKYPSSVDFYGELSKNPKILDEVVKYVLWFNLNSAELKYKYVFENYLDIDGNSPSIDAGHKSDYEIAYLGGRGDAQNMFIRLNPEKSQENLTSDKVKGIRSNFANFKAALSASKMTNSSKGAGNNDMKCGPAEGVPLFQWMPAIMCWLKTLVPPVAISSSQCSGASLGMPGSDDPTDFGGDYPAITNPKYNDDENRNGIPDGAELIKDGNIELLADKMMHGYNKTIKIRASLFSGPELGTKLIEVDNYSKVSFDLVKLDVYKGRGKENVYIKREGDDVTDMDVIKPYISFTPIRVMAKKGTADYAFSSRSTDADVYLRATIVTKDKDNKIAISKRSEDFLVKIRGISLDASPKVGGEIRSAFEAGAASEIDFEIRTLSKDGNPIQNQVPLKLNVYSKGENIEKDILIHSSTYKYSSPILKKAGEYSFVFTDKLGIEYKQIITVNPAKIAQVKLTPSSTQFVKGSEADILVELFDAFGNRAKGDLFNVNGSLSGKGEFSENSKPVLQKSMLEGFANYKIRSNGGAGNIAVKFKVENSSAESEILTLEVVDSAKIKVNMENKDKIIVGGDKHKISINITDEDNKPLTRFSGVAYFDIPELYGVIRPNFAKVKDGVLQEEVNFVPNFVSGKDLKLNVSIPGIEKTEGNVITVFPDKPLYVGMTNSKQKLEAKKGVSSTLKAALYDRYGNLAFNDSSHKVTFEVPAEFKKYANFEGTRFTESKDLEEGVAKTSIFATDLPGSAFITATVTPSLEPNGYTQTDASGKSVTIPGNSENLVPFDSYYLYNGSKLDKIDYNALYTVLQGANYGDITKPGYLGGEILFNRNGRSLGVTTIINNPFARETAFGFTPGGRYIASGGASKDQTMDIVPEMSTTSRGTSIELYDSVYKELVSRAWLNFDENVRLVNCTSNKETDISKCQVPQDASFIVLKGVGDAKIKENPSSLALEVNGFSVFSIAKDGKISKDPSLKIELDTDATGNMLGARLMLNKEQAGYLGIKFKTDKIDVYESSSFPEVLNSHKNQIVLEYLSTDYSFDHDYLGTSSHGAKGISFYRADSGDENVDPSLVSQNGKLGLENYTEQAGIGWENKNKMLLEFAAGSNLGESTRYYHTYSMINLGDPVISLGSKKDASYDFDKTIGKKILEGKSSPIESYKKMDFNADGNPDIAVFYENGYIELLANYNGEYKDMGNLAYVSDAGKDRKGVGDFSNDRYEDIAFADKNGKLGILDNELGKFTRYKPIILDISGSGETALNGAIQQLEIFDMDSDGRSDIITVDDSGELNILYGAGNDIEKYRGAPVFHKKMIDNTLGLKLGNKKTKDGGAMYYDGLPQLGDFSDQSKNLLSSEKLAADFRSSNRNPTDASDTYNSMVDRLIYFQERYQATGSGTLTQEEKEKAILAAIGTDENGQPNTAVASQIIQAQNDILLMNTAGMTNISNINPGLTDKTRTFIRSQFAEANNIRIEKEYVDANGKTLQSNDVINVILKITNSGTSALKDIIYYDSNKNFLQHDSDGVYTINTDKGSSTRKIKTKDDGEFSLAFDDFSLAAGETATITYKLSMPVVSFGKIIVGLVMKDDTYGDIALNPSNQCGADQVVWASTAARAYKRGLQEFEDNTKLPDALEKNKKDENNNGVPDYIEDLTNDAKVEPYTKAKEFGEEQLRELNKDLNNNGIPDKDEESGGAVFEFDADSGEVSLDGLSEVNIDAINSGIDNLVNGLGCGFGGGACISMPMNWAPLAPGGAPTLFGMPVGAGIGLVGNSTALPIFSFPTSCGPLVIWPPCPSGAGGLFGPPMGGGSSQFRLFVTPTITGAVGMAMCIGPNTAAYVKSPGVDPMIPGGQCIVAAAPLASCEGDGSDGNVRSLGATTRNRTGSGSASSGNSFINANSCVKKDEVKPGISAKTEQNIIDYMKSKGGTYLLGDPNIAKEILKDSAVQHGGLNPNSGPLIGMNGGDDEGTLDLDIDMSALQNLDYSNIVKINYSRVASFPDYIMDWVTRQIEEIVNKLTTLPTLYIIFPDFSGFADSGWSDWGEKYKAAKEKVAKENELQNQKNAKQLADENAKATQNISDEDLQDAQKYVNGAKNSLKNLPRKNGIQGGADSIKSAYEVISNLPLIKLETESIDINIPWVGPEDASKWIDDSKIKVEQWKTEVKRAKDEWKELKGKEGYDKHFKALLDAEKLISSIEKNIQVLEDIKKFPTKLREYINWKEKFITQLMCNFETINKVTGGWITENGKRFRSWVELIVLLKAILKSYQMIIDIFTDFNATCSVCHNERNNLTYWLIKLISAMIPKLPVIVFPKWPDIILDLHNIRAGITVTTPEFRFKVVPMVLPQLPDLYLPKVPNASLGINLPMVPVLPGLPELPTLPDLPTLPEVKLPDLPPPPKIPNIFGSIQAALNLLKLIAKVLCLYKQIGNMLPPEWRAGDAIAWMTERNGTLPIDKLFIDFPQFSVPFVDAIKVTTYVNLEFEVDFIVEMAKSTLEPFNRFSNDLSNLSKGINLPDLDLRPLSPDDVNLDIQVAPQSYENKKEEDKNIAFIATLAGLTVGGITQIVKELDEGRKEQELGDFKAAMRKSVAKLATSNDPKEKQIYSTITKALDFDASGEKQFIDDLTDKNDQKFDLLRRIMQEKLDENRKLDKELIQIERGSRSIKEWSPLQKLNSDSIKVSAGGTDKNPLITSLEKNQDGFISAVEKLSKPANDQKELSAAGKDIMSKVNDGITSFKAELKQGIPVELGNNTVDKRYATAPDTSSAGGLDYSYDYEGIYILNSEGKQTRLFDYLDEVDKDSDVIELDHDKDGDLDVIYMMGNSLYLKTNLRSAAAKNHISGVDSARDISDINGFLGISGNDAHVPLAPNFFQELTTSSNNINFNFRPANTDKQSSFRLEYYDHINRFDQTNNQKAFNKSIFPYARMNLIDLVTTMTDDYTLSVKPGLIIKDNFATIDKGVGDVSVSMPEYKMLGANDAITIQAGKTIYAGEAGLAIKYKFPGDDSYKMISLDKRTNMEFLDTANITVMSGDMILIYDSSKRFEGDIADLKGFPVLPGMHMEFANKNGYVNIDYVGGGILTIDNASTYEMYSLGEKKEKYNVSISRENGFYYAKLYEFSNNRKSNMTSLSLLSPQFQSDMEPPLLGFESGLKLPVYKKQAFNLKQYIDDVSGISEIYVDFDPATDSDGDGIVDNDKDSLNPANTFNIHKGNTWYDLILGSFDKPFKKKILVSVKDNNENIATSLIDLEVYVPVPKISQVQDGKITGSLDEMISEEPIDIFRYRNGVLEKIKTTSQDRTGDKGEFNITSQSTASGIIIRSGTGEIARLNETTGKIEIKNSDYALQIKGADASNKTRIQLYSKARGNILYEQSFNLPAQQNIQGVGSFDNLDRGIYFRSDTDGYRFTKNASNAPSLANGAFITDPANKAVIGIGQDGNIYIMDDAYKLNYDTRGEYVVLNIINGGGIAVGSIFFKLSAVYIIK